MITDTLGWVMTRKIVPDADSCLVLVDEGSASRPFIRSNPMNIMSTSLIGQPIDTGLVGGGTVLGELAAVIFGGCNKRTEKVTEPGVGKMMVMHEVFEEYPEQWGLKPPLDLVIERAE